MQQISVWKSSAKEYSCLNGDLKRDIVVIGGGIAGFLTAFKLAEAGKSVTLIEADRLFSGTTGKTTAKITANQGTVYSELALRYGKEHARLYYNAQTEGMRGFEQLIQKYGIDCDFVRTDGLIFSQKGNEKLKKTCNLLQGFGADCDITENTQPIDAVCALEMKNQYLFDPLKFLCALPVSFEIFEHTRAVDIDAKNKIILCDSGKICANKIVIATHFPVINSFGAYYLKLRQSLSYTIAVSERLSESMFLDEKDEGLSLRPYSGGTIIGGCDHRTGRPDRVNRFEILRAQANKLNAKDITHFWSAQDVMTFDGMPMAGLYSRKLNGVYVITGFNKWGMANSMVCAEVISDIILGKENKYVALFSPQRKIKGCFGDFISNAATNIKYIFKGYMPLSLKSADNVEKGCGAVVRYKGKKRAVYRDRNGKIFAIGRMCPHMHGELQWNAETKTWDCPCHGSRFDIFGNIISEPSEKHCKFYDSNKNRK